MTKFKLFDSIALASVMLLGVGCAGGEDQAQEDDEFAELGLAVPSCTVSQVPAMVSATSPSGVVTSSGDLNVWEQNTQTGMEGFRAFDSNLNSMWGSLEGVTPAWLAYEWKDGPRRITNYAIKFSNGRETHRAPRDFSLQGWNGTAWVEVDRRTGQRNWGGAERRAFTVTTPGSFSKYRLHITEDNTEAPQYAYTAPGVHVVTIGSLELFECPTYTTTVTYTQDWATGYCADVKVTNPTSQAISSWTLSVNSQQSSIYESWSSTRTGAAPNYTFKPLAWNSSIPAGGSQTVGFCASKTGSNYRPVVSVTSP